MAPTTEIYTLSLHDALAPPERPQRQARTRYLAQWVRTERKQHHQPHDQVHEGSRLAQKKCGDQEEIVARQRLDRGPIPAVREGEGPQDREGPSHSNSSTTGVSTRSK